MNETQVALPPEVRDAFDEALSAYAAAVSGDEAWHVSDKAEEACRTAIRTALTAAEARGAPSRTLVGNEAARYLAGMLRRLAGDGVETAMRVGLLKIADDMESQAVGSDEQLAYERGLADGEARGAQRERERITQAVQKMFDRVPKKYEEGKLNHDWSSYDEGCADAFDDALQAITDPDTAVQS
jgi:hypothetical protein